MPELPEVESQARDLRRSISDRRILDVWVGWKKSIATPSAQAFKEKLKGQRFGDIKRRGKFIIINLGKFALVSHFRMTGHFRLVPLRDSKSAREWYLYPKDRFTRVAFKLDRQQVLHFSDIRKFGRLWLVDAKKVDQLPELHALGPEPLAPSFTAREFIKCLRRHSGMIKPVLLKQDCVAGIGNIYADESLFDAQIHPKTRVKKLSDQQLTILFQMVRSNLADGVGHHGASVGDYINLKGDKGRQGFYLRVYGQAGQACGQRRGEKRKTCRGRVKRIVVAQRGTHICPACQKVQK